MITLSIFVSLHKSYLILSFVYGIAFLSISDGNLASLCFLFLNNITNVEWIPSLYFIYIFLSLSLKCCLIAYLFSGCIQLNLVCYL